MKWIVIFFSLLILRVFVWWVFNFWRHAYIDIGDSCFDSFRNFQLFLRDLYFLRHLRNQLNYINELVFRDGDVIMKRFVFYYLLRKLGKLIIYELKRQFFYYFFDFLAKPYQLCQSYCVIDDFKLPYCQLLKNSFSWFFKSIDFVEYFISVLQK